MTRGKREDVILLSILPKFAEQIFSGEKKYEFRKPFLPSQISYVVLVENGSREILGGFRVGEVTEASINELWDKYAKDISEKDRFYRYYEGWSEGIAVEVEEPDEYNETIPIEELTDMDPNLQVPDQFSHIYLTNRSMSLLTEYSNIVKELFPIKTLGKWQNSPQKEQNNPEYHIREMNSDEQNDFRRLVSESQVPDKYGEIDESFVQHIIESHKKGNDPYGYFTLKKKIHAFVYKGKTIGFTVTTWKRGHSVKFGPTVIETEFRNQGLGPEFRKKLDGMLRTKGIHKVYSTIPETAENAYSYLIKSGYNIEAHMRKQYNNKHSELVFGKLLGEHSTFNSKNYQREEVSELEFDIGSKQYEGFSEFVVNNMSNWYGDIEKEFVESVQQAENRDLEGDLSKKGKRVYIGHDSNNIKCAIVASRKRGEAIKLSPLLTTASGKIVDEFISFVEGEIMSDCTVRKFYSHVPLSDTLLLNKFKLSNYVVEGILKEPYKKGEDMVFVGKLTQNNE